MNESLIALARVKLIARVRDAITPYPAAATPEYQAATLEALVSVTVAVALAAADVPISKDRSAAVAVAAMRAIRREIDIFRMTDTRRNLT